MPDEIMKELWDIKDSIAREHGYDVEAFAAHLRARKRSQGERVVDLRAVRKANERGEAPDADNPRQ